MKSNCRNGYSENSIITDDEEADIDFTRDRGTSFAPQLAHRATHSNPVVSNKILSLYAKGMTAQRIVATHYKVYLADVSSALISKSG
ncbi:transposase [Vibrio cyclitrophicus]|uniref:transposase n=1 Tax=Vibrio cyclitrophicus TaxID=47951 RepID=UPI000C85CD00